MPADGERIATIKASYNGMIQSLQGQVFTGLKGTKPPMEPPIPDSASFYMFGQKDGKDFAFQSITVFGKKGTYMFQMSGGTEAEVAKLGKVSEALKEQ